MDSIRLALQLIPHPFRTVRDERFVKGKLWVWPLCEVPLLAVLLLTGMIDPAEGFGRDAQSLVQYLFSSAIIIAGSMALTVFKCFLCLWAGGVRSGFLDSVRNLLPLLCLLALLEAFFTVLLFVLSRAAGTTVYQICSQLQLFGQELLFAAGAALWMHEGPPRTNSRRAITVGLACFLLSSAWLLLPVFY